MKTFQRIVIFALCAITVIGASCAQSGTQSGSLDSLPQGSSTPAESSSSGTHSNAEDSSPREDSSSPGNSSSWESSSSETSAPPADDTPDDETPELDGIYRLTADNRYVAIDVQNSISTTVGKMSFITKSSYQGIKRIAFNAKTGDKTSWWGIALADSAETANVYNTDLTVGYVSTNDYWVTFVFDFAQTGCSIYSTQGGFTPKVLTKLTHVPYTEDGDYYIHFVGPLWETFSQPICLDNFTIVLDNGATYVDSFDEGANTGLFKTDKAVTHVIDDSVQEPFPAEPATALQPTSEVFYQSDDKIDFTAYAPVTVANWSGSGSSNPNLVTDEQYRYMAEAGFTKSLGLYEGRTGDSGYTYNEKVEKDTLSVLQFAEKYGIKYYALNEKFYNFVRPSINIDFFNLTYKNGKYYNAIDEEVSTADTYRYLKPNWKKLYQAKMSEMFDANTKYIDSPAYGGNFASDEPAYPILVDGKWYYGELEQLYYQISMYNEYMEKHSLYGGEAYVNLLPYGAINPEIRESYEVMMDYYFEKLAPMLGYVSYDHYPLNASPIAYVSATHLLNLEMMANHCKEYDVELRSFLWAKTTVGAGHRAIFNANDLRFQAYANLAFGVKEMPYYTYFNYYAPGENGCNSLIDCQTGARTSAYYWAKEVNNEIHSLEKAYLNFRWEGSMYFDAGMKTRQFSLLETSLTSHNRLTNILSQADTLVGVFSDQDGKNGATDGFVVMNYSDPYYANKGATDNVLLTFDNATHALVYKDGRQYVAKLNSGKLSLALEAGEGVFVVPFAQ